MRCGRFGKACPSATSPKKHLASTPRGLLLCFLRAFDGCLLIGRYPELRELELKQLAWTLSSADSDHTLKLLKEKIKAYTHGKLPHAKHVISALYKLMENDQSPKEPLLPVTVSSNRKGTSRDWAGLKKALTTSLTSGTFLDSQFYAIESRSSTSLPNIRPVYFCSAVNGNLMSKLTACKSLTRIICA